MNLSTHRTLFVHAHLCSLLLFLPTLTADSLPLIFRPPMTLFSSIIEAFLLTSTLWWSQWLTSPSGISLPTVTPAEFSRYFSLKEGILQVAANQNGRVTEAELLAISEICWKAVFKAYPNEKKAQMIAFAIVTVFPLKCVQDAGVSIRIFIYLFCLKLWGMLET